MKRSIGSLLLAMAAVGVFAQANFTIVRPVDGAKVREKVRVLFPKGSVPSGGYVGIFLDGVLIDAVVPSPSGKYLEYVLDTKARGLADSAPGKPLKLEAKLYVPYKDDSRVTRVSSVDIHIGNKANIPVPNSGIKLRYNFKPGTQMIYTYEQRIAIDTISESQNKLGGKPSELPLDSETIRLLYAVDNTYPGGSGLVRLQALPQKGKDYAMLTTTSATEQKQYFDYMMAPVYMKLTSTGQEVFGSVPLYYPLEGTSGQGNSFDLFAVFPLPTLPEKAVRPGDAWQSRFQNGKLDMTKLFEQTSLVKSFPARGEFLGVEWEMGHPCAKIRNSIAEAEMSIEDKKLIKSGANFGGDKIQMNEEIWFALDSRKILRVKSDIQIEQKVEGGSLGGNPQGGPPGATPGGAPGLPGGPRKGGRGGKDDIVLPDMQKGRPGGRPGMQGAPGPAGGPQGRGGFPGGPQGGFPGSNRGGAPAQAQYVRIHIQRIFTLEQ